MGSRAQGNGLQKVDFGGQSTTMALSSIRQLHTDYSVKASPWREWRGDLLLEVSQAATEFDMDMGSTYRRGMPTVLSISGAKRTIMPIIWLS